MDPQDEAELARLLAAHKSAEKWEDETRMALFAFLQGKLLTGPRRTLKELTEKTPYSRQRLGDIKAGRWSRTPSRNPAPPVDK